MAESLVPLVIVPIQMKIPLSRSPGERAFDRCFYPFGAVLSLIVLGFFVDLLSQAPAPRKLQAHAKVVTALVTALPDPTWHNWLPLMLGVLLFVYCLWAFWGVIRTWRDPRAKVLRFCALLLLVFDASIAMSLMNCYSLIAD